MPATLVLRAENAPWMLERSSCPPLPLRVNRRGLFQLRSTQEHLRRLAQKDHYISVRRSGFSVMPADTRIVYEAQGETFEAVVADMERPPRMDPTTHWLACYVMLSRARSLEFF